MYVDLQTATALVMYLVYTEKVGSLVLGGVLGVKVLDADVLVLDQNFWCTYSWCTREGRPPTWRWQHRSKQTSRQSALVHLSQTSPLLRFHGNQEFLNKVG